MRARNEILVVEDDPSIRQTIAECLELEGYDVRQAASGTDALAELGRERLPAMVLLDLLIPEMSGPELFRCLRDDPRTASVPVVLMTAAMPLLTGPVPQADGMLTKPFALAELLAQAARFCGKPNRSEGVPADAR